MQQESFSQKAVNIADSAATYCAGGGLAGFSCLAGELNPIMQFIGLFVGIVVCLAKGIWDFQRRNGRPGKPSNDR